ncbi:MAG TPA: cytochrome c3 family protein [Kofleriaceae bacterium]|nr:cytochrome c3 family protein [Kofleriaceae bacterium]
MRKHRTRRGVERGLVALAAALLGCAIDIAPRPPPPLEDAVGLDLAVTDGQAAALALQPGRRYYVNQVQVRAKQLGFPAPDALEWLQAHSQLARLDWAGIDQVGVDIEASGGAWRELQPHLDAAWMGRPARFEVEARDAGGPLAGPFVLDAADFVIGRQTAMVWIDGEPAPGDYGANAGDYTGLSVISGGAFAGADEVYAIEVVTAGGADGSARVTVTSARGDLGAPEPVISGSPIALGDDGVTIRFTDSADPPTVLVAGDRWVVRCQDGVVGPALAGTPARFSALAESRLQFPRADDAPVFELPEATTELRLTWDALPAQPWTIPVTFTDGSGPDYGLEPELALSAPADGAVYAPGESVEAVITLRDGDGQRLHPEGALPTYRQFVDGESAGIQYYRLGVAPGDYFFTEYRLNILRVALFGPKQLVRQRYGDEEPFVVQEINLPDVASVVMAGQAPGSSAWDTPIPDRVSFTLPDDAPPGTYVVSLKVSRAFGGQVLHREVHTDIQVGDAEPTAFAPGVGNCGLCHAVDAKLERLRHGIDAESPRYCDACHGPPHGTVGALIHTVHFFSSAYPVRKSGCALCHLEPDSNTRVSMIACGACHGEIHPGEPMAEGRDPYARCGETCHDPLPAVHIVPRTF